MLFSWHTDTHAEPIALSGPRKWSLTSLQTFQASKPRDSTVFVFVPTALAEKVKKSAVSVRLLRLYLSNQLTFNLDLPLYTS